MKLNPQERERERERERDILSSFSFMKPLKLNIRSVDPHITNTYDSLLKHLECYWQKRYKTSIYTNNVLFIIIVIIMLLFSSLSLLLIIYLSFFQLSKDPIEYHRGSPRTPFTISWLTLWRQNIREMSFCGVNRLYLITFRRKEGD